MHDIFISYSRHDLKVVQPIKEELERLGFSCWMDLEGIESGAEEFTKHIAAAIGGSTAVLFFLSKTSQKSQWSLNELRLARKKKKHVVLVRINDDEKADEFELLFGGTDGIDWRKPEQKEKLLRDLGRWTGNTGTVPFHEAVVESGRVCHPTEEQELEQSTGSRPGASPEQENPDAPLASNARTSKTSKWGWVVAVGGLVLLCVAGATWKGSQDKTVKWYLDAASRGNVEAQLHLGRLYEEGLDVAKSDEEAFKWYWKAAQQGHAVAQTHLAVMYHDGRGVERNYAEAAKWCRLAATQDYPDAQCNLGELYLDGLGVWQSDTEALKWFRKAAEHGNANGQAHLASMFAEGRGVEQNTDEADKLYKQAADGFRKAAEQGDAEAQHNLGWLYEKGLGVQQSDSEADMWFRKAAEQGYQEDNRLHQSSPLSLYDMLQRIIIPSLELRQANIADIVSYLMDASSVADPDGEGIRITLALAKGETIDVPPISLNLRDINMKDAIASITKAAGLKWKVANKAVIITSGDVTDWEKELETMEEIRIQAAEADALKATEQGFRCLSDGNLMEAEKSFTEALDSLPNRPQNEADRETISWGLAEAKYLRARSNVQQQVRCKESRALINDALKLVPTHEGALKLDKTLRKLGY